jgi:hypothetical protein
MAGVLLLSADGTTVRSNRLSFPDNPTAARPGKGILVSNTCCGLGATFLPGSRFTTIAFNDARRSEVGIVVEGSGWRQHRRASTCAATAAPSKSRVSLLLSLGLPARACSHPYWLSPSSDSSSKIRYEDRERTARAGSPSPDLARSDRDRDRGPE